MKIKEIHAMSDPDLKEKLKQLKGEMIKFNAQIAVGTNPKSPGQVKTTKKLIAKILQEMHVRTLKGKIEPKEKNKKETKNK